MKTKKYAGSVTDAEKKLARVMDRLGVEKYQVDWSNSRSDTLVWVEMIYNGTAYRFENSIEKSRDAGRNFNTISDLLFSIVYSLEGLARAVEQDIFTLDMLMKGVPALPAASSIPACYKKLGFTTAPASADEIHKKYRELARQMHPDAGGTNGAFVELGQTLQDCLAEYEKR